MEQEEVLNKLIIEFSKTLEVFNLSPLEARLFVHLYLSKEPMTLDDMSEALGKSKTSMSTSTRHLYEANLISQVWKKGVRKDLYEANNDLFNTFVTSHFKQITSLIHRQKEVITNIEGQINNSETFQNQIKDIIAFHSQLETLFENIKLNANT